MKKKLLGMAALVPVLLASCGRQAELTEYIKEVPLFANKEEVRILQLTDLHWSLQTDVEYEIKVTKKIVEQAHPDFIFITGDSILVANPGIVDAQIAMFEGFNLPWTMVFGNHDKQGTFNRTFWTDRLQKAKNCYFVDPNDDVYGDCNHVVNLTDGNGKTCWQLYGIDSNAETFNGIKYTYDIIHDDTVDWYEKEVNLAKEKNGGVVVPSIAYFHIPLWESVVSWFDANSENPKHLHYGSTSESSYEVKGLGSSPFYPGYARGKMFSTMSKLHSTKAAFYGHDHKNNFVSNWSIEGGDEICLGYGIKSSPELTYLKDLIGGTVLKLHKDGSFNPLTGTVQETVLQDMEEVIINLEDIK